MPITQGDNGTPFNINLIENGEPINDLLSATAIEIKFKNKGRTFLKSAIAIDNDTAQVVLTSEDLADFGKYEVQARVTYPPDKEFRSAVGVFLVGRQL